MKNIVVIGATGAVGREVVDCLQKLEFPVGKLRLVASERSAGKMVSTPWGDVTLEVISEEVFAESDIAIFAAGGDLSKEWREKVVAGGCLMIDNSSAFRYDDDVPLIVPGVNTEAAFSHNGVIANPNCTTAIAAMALWPLHKKFGLKKVIVSTYQATSGAGAEGMEELVVQTREVLEKCGEDSMKLAAFKVREHSEVAAQPKVFAHQIAFNLIPQIDSFQENGYTKEEMKVTWETRKIFGVPELAVSCTAVRIPTLRAHSESIVIETAQPISAEEARQILEYAEGVEVVDEPSAGRYPMPMNASYKYDVEVGRIRQNLVFGDHGLELFVSGDQLLRGAALNAVEIAKLFV